jgi:hypothetical protein
LTEIYCDEPSMHGEDGDGRYSTVSAHREFLSDEHHTI